ncbi:MAG: hypothetical protein O3B87_01680 [bacterium]|nr:hypothetical protein [bacterium]
MSESKYESISRLENLINGHQMDLDKLQSGLKDQAAMLNAAFENDAAYLEAHKDMQEATKKKKVEKDRIIKEPAIASLNAKVQDIRSQVKEEKQALSDYLTQYFQESGLRQITGTDGEIREIVTSVRLVKKRE